MPSKAGKGVLVVPTIHGNYLLGPNSETIEDKEGINNTRVALDYVKKEIQKTITYVVGKTQNLDENLIEKVIEQSFSGKKSCKEFEDSIFNNS